MRKMADRPIADYIREQFNQAIHPFDRDLISVSELFDWLSRNTKIRITRQREIADVLKDIGGIMKKSCPVDKLGHSVNIWIIRNQDEYKNMTARDIGLKYVPFYTGEF